jgi:hypothetical protein
MNLSCTGRIISAISELFFLLMLLLLAKGWTVVRGRLTSQSQMRLTILMTLYSSVYTTMFIWEAAVSYTNNTHIKEKIEIVTASVTASIWTD